VVSGTVTHQKVSASNVIAFDKAIHKECALHGYELTTKKVAQGRKIYRLVLCKNHEIELLVKFVLIEKNGGLTVDFSVSIGWAKAAAIQQRLRVFDESLPAQLKDQLQEPLDSLVDLPITSDSSIFKTTSPAVFKSMGYTAVEEFVFNSVKAIHEVALPKYKHYCDASALVSLVRQPSTGIYIAETVAAAIMEAAI
jgi:hypothetical protein